MHDARNMRRREGMANGLQDRAYVLGAQRALAGEGCGEVFPFEHLHRDEWRARGFIDARGDDLDDMITWDLGTDPGFLLEAFAQLGVADEAWVHQLQRAFAPGAELFGDVDRAHAAGSELPLDPKIAPQNGPSPGHLQDHEPRIPKLVGF